MPGLILRAMRIIVHPSREWAAIAHEPGNALHVLLRYLVPLGLIAPIANAFGVLIAPDDALRAFPDSSVALQFVLLVWGGFVTQLLGMLIVALVLYLVMPLYEQPRNLGPAITVVAYAGTPIWLAGIVLLAPVQRFPILVVIILVGLMHGAYLFYLGLHHIAKVREREAAECTAVVVFVSLVLSTAVGYLGGAAGLFPHP